MTEYLRIPTLAEVARAHLGGAAPELRPIATGKHNRSFWVLSEHGRFVLRVAPPDSTGLLFYERLMMRQEPALHQIMHQEPALPVAEIVAHDFSRRLIDRDYLLMTALPGMPMSDAALSAAQNARVLRQVGAALRALHAIEGPAAGLSGYGYLGAHHPMAPQPSWWQAFQLMRNLLLDDVAAAGTYTSAEAERLRGLLSNHAAAFQRDVPAALLHMDVWAQNILVDQAGNLAGLVDFDRALWGDPEIEYAVLDYCGISEPSFWQGYGHPRDISPAAEIRRLFYLLYEVQKYMPICVWRRGDLADAQRYREQCLRLARQLE
jgi:aminoglycoside phosphotransferase (APT) family kinase protein